MAVVFGCASSKTSTGKTEMPTGAPDGTIHWEGKEFMALLEGQWGHGTLAFNGKVYKFKTSAVGAGGYLYDHHEKAQQKAHDEAYEKGYEAGKKSQ